MSDERRLAELKADDGGITRDDFLFLLALYEKAEADLAQAVGLLNDDRFIRTLYDYRVRGHLSYAGQLDERVGGLGVEIIWRRDPRRPHKEEGNAV